jgi:hypothetical protein
MHEKNRSRKSHGTVPLKVHKHEIFLNTFFFKKPNPYGFKSYPKKNLIKMQCSIINNRNFGNCRRIPSNRTKVKILNKKISDASQ